MKTMNMINRFTGFLMAFAFLVIGFPGCSDSDNGGSSVDLSNRLYVTVAQSGNLIPTGEADEYVITLDGVLPEVRWFTDRPERDTGENQTADFVERLWPFVYDSVAPNAIIKFHVAGENAGVFATLKSPQYDSDTATLTFQATLLNYTFDEKPTNTLLLEIPVVTILNNVYTESGGASYAVYGENASLEETSTEGQFQLIQDDMDDEVLYAYNAPHRYSQVSTTARFVEEWATTFRDIPPNAVIFGTTDDGELLGRLLTLSEPQYDEAGNRVIYPATVLGLEGKAFAQLNSATLIIDSAGGSSAPPKNCGVCTNPPSTENQHILNFAGYRWYTNWFHWKTGQWYDVQRGQGNNQNYPTVDGQGLHLLVSQKGGYGWQPSEVVAVQRLDGSTMSFGYGKYLVAARRPAGSFADLDKNVAFGAFTFDCAQKGDNFNPLRELDLIEASRWGWLPGDQCTEECRELCSQNAQFTVQLWNHYGASQCARLMNRYTLTDSGGITLTMDWKGPHQPVTFRQYNGIYGTLADAEAATAANEWTTPADLNPFIPKDDKDQPGGCIRFHLNLWLGNYHAPIDGNGRHPGPSNGQDQEIVVTHFVYEPY